MNRNYQSGVALFTALIFLLILTLIGVTALRNSGLSERMSTNAQIAQMAFNAAESAANRYKSEYNFKIDSVTTLGTSKIQNDYLPTEGVPGSSFF